jgi:hypothetical protein
MANIGKGRRKGGTSDKDVAGSSLDWSPALQEKQDVEKKAAAEAESRKSVADKVGAYAGEVGQLWKDTFK